MRGLASRIVVAGLLRAAETAGGNGVVLARGDGDTGALLVVLTSRGGSPEVLERLSGIEGGFTWNRSQLPDESTQIDSVARLIDKKKRFDRDLWVVELDIPDVEQFIVDSLAET